MTESGRVVQRRHAPAGQARPKQAFVRLSEEEHETLSAAARSAGLTLAGYLAVAGMAAAKGTQVPGGPAKDALHELMQARSLLGRINGNLNKLAAALLSGAEVPRGTVEAAIDAAARVTARVDQAAEAVHRRVR